MLAGNGFRWLSVEAAVAEPIPPPAMSGEPKVYPEKVKQIVADISTLTLLETSQLNELLKVHYNIVGHNSVLIDTLVCWAVILGNTKHP